MTRPQSPAQITALGIIALPHSQERHARQPSRACAGTWKIHRARPRPHPPAFSPTEFLRRLRSAETLISFGCLTRAKTPWMLGFFERSPICGAKDFWASGHEIALSQRRNCDSVSNHRGALPMPLSTTSARKPAFPAGSLRTFFCTTDARLWCLKLQAIVNALILRAIQIESAEVGPDDDGHRTFIDLLSGQYFRSAWRRPLQMAVTHSAC